jgi:CRP-like cAMP-binding protein
VRTASGRTRERMLFVAGLMGLGGLATSLLYAFHSTPYTMVFFMAVGLTLIFGAALVFALAILRDYRGRLTSLTARDLQDAEVVHRQGEEAEYMYILTEGEVEFTVAEAGEDPTTLGKLGPGEYFGDMAVLRNEPYQATARAVGPVKVLLIHRDDFRSLYTHLPNLRERVRKAQAQRLAMAEKALGRKVG